jgi:hypothetical protein
MRLTGLFQEYSIFFMRPFGFFCIQSRDAPWLRPLSSPSPPSHSRLPRVAINSRIIAITVTLATLMELLDTAVAKVAQTGNVVGESLKVFMEFRIFAD